MDFERGGEGLKVYISADMEGITGLVDAEDVQPPGRDYERGRVMMTEDVNAASGAPSRPVRPRSSSTTPTGRCGTCCPTCSTREPC